MMRSNFGESMVVASWRRNCAVKAAAALLATAGLTLGCNETETNAFRDAAAPALEAGVNSLLGAVVDGAFAVFETTRDSSSSTDSSASGDGTTGTDAATGG